MRERILITGPGGRVGPHIVPLLRQHYALRLLDIKPFRCEGDDEFVQADIRDFEALRKACEGVRAMVHLAAVPDEDDFHTKLLPMNLVGGYHAFEAARQARVKKIVFTSTGQTVLNYGRGVWVGPEMAVRPSTIYACTKVFGEALGRHYSDCHQMSVICIRLCWFQGYDSKLLQTTPEMLADWCSPRDLVQLIVKSIQTDLPFGIFFGISNNTGRYRDISNGKELLGFEPEDNASDFYKGHSS